MESVLPVLLGVAWLLPLASFTLIVLAGPTMGKGGRLAAYVATGAILCSAGLSFTALSMWLYHHPLEVAAHHEDAEHGPSEHGEPADDTSQEATSEHGAQRPTSARAVVAKTTCPACPPGRFSFAGGGSAGIPLQQVSRTAGAEEANAPEPREDAEDKAEAEHHAGAISDEEHAEAHHAPTAKPVYAGTWYRLARFGRLKVDVGYYIDALTVAMFAMVTFIATCIHFYAIGYMHDELHEVTDHEVKLANGHALHRPGRFHRFFQYLSLFCFSMLGLVVAGNIAMVFVFWELVGICSYFLIGFYTERKSASNAANKAFIVNRVGDFGMIIGLMALFGALGTFNFGDVVEHGQTQPGIFSLLRPADQGHQLIVPDGMVVAAARDRIAAGEVPTAERIARWREQGLGYGLLVVAGLGIFCGCVGKSAQFPLHVWLPDAMEGPTPVSALVHSATMVAAGVYLVGRFFPAFAPEVLLTIAYIGMITLFLAASIALTATDIKRVLAYSTVSQLGYMMLALGVGGWLAGLYHLFTHAFFKSLLFMCSGSVIHACHTNEMPRMGGLLRKMPYTALTMLIGCLAIAGAGIPFVLGMSGYYSKDAILAQAFSFSGANGHAILFYAVAGGAAMTAFYMFRLWYMTFAGTPRDKHVFDHAHESPAVMTVPLMILASLAVFVAWPANGMLVGIPLAGALWLAVARTQGSGAHSHEDHGHEDHGHEDHSHSDHSHGDHGHGAETRHADALATQHDSHPGDGHGDAHAAHDHGTTDAARKAGWGLPLGLVAVAILALVIPWPERVTSMSLENLLEQARPAGPQSAGLWVAGLAAPDEHASHATNIHNVATAVAFLTALGGFLLATAFYGWRVASADEVARAFRPIYAFLKNKWYFDELYHVIFFRPAHLVAAIIAQFDKQVIDGLIDASARGAVAISQWDDWVDRNVVDKSVNVLARWMYAAGLWLRVLQTGRLRTYVMLIVVGTIGLFILLGQLLNLAQASP